MSIAISKNKAGIFLALLLTAVALPGWSEEKAQQATASTPDASEAREGATSGDPAQQPAPAPTPSQAGGVPVPTPPESTTPPKNLHKVGDHWTPYEPPDPESFPEGAQIHVIVAGDNLWNLANTQFQNPYLWPQIWNENRYVLDSHWIYPGDPLLLPPRPTVVSEIVPASGEKAPPLPAAPETETAPEGGESPDASLTGTPDQMAEALLPEEPASGEPGPGDMGRLSAVDHSDIYCTGEIRRDYKKTDIYISNEEQEGKIGLTEGDLVYLNAGRQGDKVSPGEEFQIVVKGEEVFHPVTDKYLGTYVHRAGRVKVLAVQESTAIAQITETCGDRIEVGFELEPYQEMPLPETREVPFSRLDVEPGGGANGYVVRLQDGRNQAFTGNVVDLDLGSRDGLKPGDILQVYLKSTPPVEQRVKYNYKWGNRRYKSQELRDEDKNMLYPRKPIGNLMVLTTEEKTSTAKVLYTVREIEVGTQVEVR